MFINKEYYLFKREFLNYFKIKNIIIKELDEDNVQFNSSIKKEYKFIYNIKKLYLFLNEEYKKNLFLMDLFEENKDTLLNSTCLNENEIDELISRTPKLLNDKNKILNILLIARNGIINEKYDYTFTFNDYFINNINSIELRFLSNNTDEFLELLNLEKIIKNKIKFYFLVFT